MINFSDKEKELIKESIDLRLKSSEKDVEFYKRHISDLKEILKRIDSSFIDLKPNQKSIIIGCIRELIIYPNEELLKLSDYQVFFLPETFKEKLNIIDIGLSVINKLQKKSEPKHVTFESRFIKIESLLNTKEIYYSETNNEKIYKVGILTEKEKGIHIEMEGTLISGFDISKLSRESYMKSAEPKEIIEKIKTYGKQNELTENQKRLLKILEKASV